MLELLVARLVMDILNTVMRTGTYLMAQVRLPAIFARCVPVSIEVCVLDFHEMFSVFESGGILRCEAYAYIKMCGNAKFCL